MALEIEQFNPTVADLQELVATAGMLTLPDPTDEIQLRAVKDKRIQLRDARVTIEKKGKELRQEAVDFQKAVIGREKELIAIIEPEEQRLKALEEEAKHILVMNKRRELLPERRERLAALGTAAYPDESLLDLDDEAFEALYNRVVADKNAKATAEIEARERAVLEAEQKEQREKEAKMREEKARQEAEARAAKEIEEANARAERAEREAQEKAEREAREKEERERLERERLAKEDHIRVTLEMHGYTEETKDDFIIRRSNNTVELFKKIATVDI